MCHQQIVLIAWKVLVEGVQHPTLTLYGQFGLDISAVLIKKAASQSARFCDP
jgi:hypothetical protein